MGDDLCRLLRLGRKAKREEQNAKGNRKNIFAPRWLNTKSKIEHRKLSHRITLSALISTTGGTVSLRARAVLRSIMNWNFVGLSTGRSAGLAPFRILSTMIAARRYGSIRSGP